MIELASCWPEVSGAENVDAVDRADRLQRLRARGADEPGVGDRAVDDRGGREERLAQRHGLRGIGAAVRGAAVDHISIAVVAGDRLGGGDPAAQRGIAIALEGETDDDDRIGRRRQRRARAGGARGRRGGRAERERGVAAQQRGLFLAHRLLQQAQGRGGVDVFKSLRRGLGFERDRVFLAERHIRRHHRRRDIGHAGAALAFRHPAYRVEAGAGDRTDGPPARGVAGVQSLHARHRVPQRRDDGIEILRRRLKIIIGQAGGDSDVLGKRFLHQA